MPYTVRFTCTSSWAFTSITIIVVIGSISLLGEFFIIGLNWPGECSDARMLANRPKPETELPPGAFHDHHHHDCGDDHYCDDREIIMTK